MQGRDVRLGAGKLIAAGGKHLRIDVHRLQRITQGFNDRQIQCVRVGARHRREIGLTPQCQMFAHDLQGFALHGELADPRDNCIGVRCDKETIDTILNALDIGSHARGNHRKPKVAKFRQRVAEGLGHGRQQHGGIGSQRGEKGGQILAAVIEHDMHAIDTKKRMRIGAGTEQENLGNLTQARQHLFKQDGTLSTPHASRKDQAQAWPRGRRRCARHFARPCRQAMRDDRRGQHTKFRGQTQIVG